MGNFLNKMKNSLFETDESDTSKSKKKPNHVPDPVPGPDADLPSDIVINTNSDNLNPSENADAMFQLQSVAEAAFTDHSDFETFIDNVEAMANIIPNMVQRYQAALATAAGDGVTLDSIIGSLDHAITQIDRAHPDLFMVLEPQKTSLKDLVAEQEVNNQRLIETTKLLEELSQNKLDLQNDINIKATEIEKTTADIELSYTNYKSQLLQSKKDVQTNLAPESTTETV